MTRLLAILFVLLTMPTAGADPAFTKLHEGEIDGVLDKARSPYLVQGKLTVPYGKRLTIEPGVLLKFRTGDVYAAGWDLPRVGRMVVEGSIVARGTAEAPIVFTSDQDATYGPVPDSVDQEQRMPWGWIRVMGLPRAFVKGHVHYDPSWMTEEEKMEYHLRSLGEHGVVSAHRSVDHDLTGEEAEAARALEAKVKAQMEMQMQHGGQAGHGGHAGHGTDEAGQGPPVDSSSVFEHCIIRNSGYHWAVEVYSSIAFEDCRFEDNISSPLAIMGGRPVIRNCDLVNNHSHGILIMEGGSAVIEGNRIVRNIGAGVSAHFAPLTVIRNNLFQGMEQGIVEPSGTTVIESNSFVDNHIAIENPQRFFLVQAPNNYWGDASGPKDTDDDRATGGGYNPDGKGGEVVGRVIYEPFLTTPPAGLEPVP